MDTLKLNSKQIQVAIDQLTAQPEGVNKLMEMALNSLMKAERATYLEAAQSGTVPVGPLKQLYRLQLTTILAV